MVNKQRTDKLLNKRILITRPRELSSSFGKQLEKHGADVVYFPAIQILPPEDFSHLDNAIQNLHAYNWIVFTSVNGVKYFFERYQTVHSDLTQPPLSVAAIGPATSDAVKAFGWQTDLLPEEYVAESLASAFTNVNGKRILMPRADIARPDLRILLQEKGARVDEITAYRTVSFKRSAKETRELLSPLPDILTFTSSSTVRFFHEATQPWQEELSECLICCIGPITEKTATEMGYKVNVVAKEFTIPGMIKALCEYHEHVH